MDEIPKILFSSLKHAYGFAVSTLQVIDVFEFEAHGDEIFLKVAHCVARRRFLPPYGCLFCSFF